MWMFLLVITNSMRRTEWIEGMEVMGSLPWKQRKFYKITKLGVMTVLAASFLLYRFLSDNSINSCILDRNHQWTSTANKQLPYGSDNIIIGIGQVLMDGWILFIFLYVVLKIKNMRYAFAVVMFFAARSVLLSANKFPFPEHVVWHNPGFFSITVPYDRTRDFYYSGHTGGLMLITIQFFVLRQKLLSLACFISFVYMANMLIVTRVHYTIDIIGGFLFSLFWSRMAYKYYFYFDKAISIPIVLLSKTIESCRKKPPTTLSADLLTEQTNDK